MEQTGWFLKPGEVSQSLYPLSRLRDGVTVGVLRQLPHVTGPVFQRELTPMYSTNNPVSFSKKHGRKKGWD